MYRIRQHCEHGRPDWLQKIHDMTIPEIVASLILNSQEESTSYVLELIPYADEAIKYTAEGVQTQNHHVCTYLKHYYLIISQQISVQIFY